MRVTLVGIVHGESGLASVVELQAILERLQPEVIFAEIPQADADHYLDGSHGNLESTAVARFRESHHVALVPVDLNRPQDEFFSNAKCLFETVERTSADFRRMMDHHSLDTRADGFAYLNSDRCIQSWEDIYREVLATVERLGDPRLREIYDVWNHTNELRDTEMIKNIQNYCVRNAFARAVFLVGTAHRRSLVNKTRAGGAAGSPRIEWDFGELLNGPG